MNAGKTFLRWCVIAIGMNLVAASIASGQDTVAANDPVALADAPIREQPTTNLTTPAETLQFVDGLTPAPDQSISSLSAAISADHLIAEQKPLGHVSPAVKPLHSAKADDRLNVVERLDPRRNEITKVVGALAVVIGLLLITRAVMRRAGVVMKGGNRPSGVLEVLAKYPVGRGQHFVLLKLARRILLLHQNGSTMTMLCEITEVNEVAAFLARLEAGSNGHDAQRFKRTLHDFTSAYESNSSPTGPTTLPIQESQIIDLTRSRKSGMSWFSSAKRGTR